MSYSTDKAFNYKCINFFKFYIKFFFYCYETNLKTDVIFLIFRIIYILHSIIIFACNNVNAEVQCTNLYIHLYTCV